MPKIWVLDLNVWNKPRSHWFADSTQGIQVQIAIESPGVTDGVLEEDDVTPFLAVLEPAGGQRDGLFNGEGLDDTPLTVWNGVEVEPEILLEGIVIDGSFCFVEKRESPKICKTVL